MERIRVPLDLLRTGLNTAFAGKEPWQITAVTATAVLTTVWIYQFIFDDELSLKERAKRKIFALAKHIPAVRERIDSELEAIRADFRNGAVKAAQELSPYVTTLPAERISHEKIIELLDGNLGGSEFDWKNGRVSGSVYYDFRELERLVRDVYARAAYNNPLHPDLFPGTCKMEAEVVRMTAKLFNGDQDVCGTMTTGGTESILMAMKAYRDYARNVLGIRKPEMVVPITAHAAFEKAAHYFRIRINYIPVDQTTFEVNLRKMRRAITKNTIVLVASAPNYPYGTMDDVVSISNLGLKYGIPVHVDSCLGGFLTAFMERAGYPIPTCDFRLPGVTSISADTHKYGFAPKGSSVILYRGLEYLHHQYTTSTDWPGGVYGSPTINGSRAGGAIATCWATLLYFGQDGYVQATRDIIHTTKYIEKGLRKLKEIFVFGTPATSVIAIGSNVFDILRLQTLLHEKAWNLSVLQFPSGIHICVTHLHTKPGIADGFLADVQGAITEIMKDPQQPVEGKMAVYGFAQALPDRSIVSDVTNCFIDSMYYTPDNDLQMDA